MSNIIKTEQNSAPKKRWSRKKRTTFAIAVTVILLSGLAVAGVYAWNYLDDQQRARDEQIRSDVVSDTRGTYLDNGLQTGEKLDYGALIQQDLTEEAADLYRSVVDSSASDVDKRTSCQEFYKVASYYEKYDQAIEAAECLVQISPDFETLYLAATAYGAAGNTDKQVEYLQKMIDTLDPISELDKATVDDLESRIAELKQGQG